MSIDYLWHALRAGVFKLQRSESTGEAELSGAAELQAKPNYQAQPNYQRSRIISVANLEPDSYV